MWRDQILEFGAGRSLHLNQAGSGRDVVLVHGALTTGHDWMESPLVAALARRFRVTIVDRPGHGLSRRPRFEGTPRDQAKQIASGLAQLDVHEPVIVGHSFGGLVGLALAEPDTAAVAGLVLVAPIVFPKPRLLEHGLLAPRAAPIAGPLFSQFATWTDRAMMPLLQKMMFAPAEVPPDGAKVSPSISSPMPTIWFVKGKMRRRSCRCRRPARSTSRPSRRPSTSSPAIPTGSYPGGQQGKMLAQLLPHAQITVIPGGGHMLHHSHPDAIIAAITDAIVLEA